MFFSFCFLFLLIFDILYNPYRSTRRHFPLPLLPDERQFRNISCQRTSLCFRQGNRVVLDPGRLTSFESRSKNTCPQKLSKSRLPAKPYCQSGVFHLRRPGQMRVSRQGIGVHFFFGGILGTAYKLHGKHVTAGFMKKKTTSKE
jgi:hypothetical protein